MGPAFGRRCIPSGCVAPPSNTPGILRRRALPAGRLAALGATPPFMRWVLDMRCRRVRLYNEGLHVFTRGGRCRIVESKVERPVDEGRRISRQQVVANPIDGGNVGQLIGPS